MSRLYRRKDSPYWYYQFGTGPGRQKSTKTKSLTFAKEIQQKWDEIYILRFHGLVIIRRKLFNLIYEYTRLICIRKSEAWSTRINQHLTAFKLIIDNR